jgi:prohibitin 2
MLILYDTLVLGLVLPPAVNAAINRKIEQYYLVQEYGFRVEREKKESERKQIEANGIRDFQQTVTQGISDSYVRWRGIEATLQLAQSPNTKIVIIGSGKDGLPVILGNVDTPMQPNPAPGASPPAGPATGTAAPGVPDNSEAARKQPAGASLPLLEKTPASNLPSPTERPSPTAVPRAPSDRPQGGAPGSPLGQAPGQQTAAPAGEQRSSWTWSEIQELVSRAIGSGDKTVGSGGPPPQGSQPQHPGAAEPPRQAEGPAPPSRSGEGPPPPRTPDRGQSRPPEQAR